MNAYGNLHNSLSTDFETETLNHYIVALPTDQNLKIFYGAVQVHTHSIFNI